ncbi:DUF4331 domain-containing protein [Noviherbaspirillum pedocola]|uniref:DUF4331 domain-containing protein n=1 Tax=Noviherbaspirillum pedocola TaxID=2801341 RepID=A0A934ST66_9BURK|nr:DUF4331 domain-containing protein [Noviherbaspirillum pedocola]MBK4734990.1 DUF4331 domain-containing protein [Noviherbaspirillum pedocola]
MRRPGFSSIVKTTLLAASVASIASMPAMASSHREGPFITGAPKVDGTDFYMFRSYESGRQDYVTLIANYIPFQDPQGGPNFYQFDPNALYEIHVDNNGDAKEDLTFQFHFKSTSKRTALPIGDKQVAIPLINSNTIGAVNPASLNVRETYTVDIVRGDRRSGTRASITGPSGAEFDKPVDNIGDKTFPGGYEAYASQHIYNVSIPGCGNGRVFVGQRKEPFYIAVGKIFDLFNLNPLGPENAGNKNDLENKNISTIAVEVPISCLTAGGDPVIGAWTTASLRQGRLINPAPASGLGNATKEGGAWAQVSRLGMPLVNEVIIGLEDKDRFNASKPKDDAQFLTYVTNPTLPALVQTLFPSAKAPTNLPRTDLVTAFLKGIKGVNQPANVTPSEMLRLNTSIAPTPAASQNALGVAGGDKAGFPNGRRPADDIVDVSLRVAMGALCVLTGDTDALQVGCKPADAPAGGLALTDGVRKTAADYGTAFPYLGTPLSGSFNQ